MSNNLAVDVGIIDSNGIVLYDNLSQDDDPSLPAVCYSKSDLLDLLKEGKSLIDACALCGMNIGDLQQLLSDPITGKEIQSILTLKYQSIDMVALDNLSHDVLLGDPRAIGLWLKTRVPQQHNVSVRLVRE